MIISKASFFTKVVIRRWYENSSLEKERQICSLHVAGSQVAGLQV